MLLINEYVDFFKKNNKKIIKETYQEISNNFNLFILTQEKALVILSKNQKLKIDWLIIDEFYNIDLSDIRSQLLFIIINLIYDNNQTIKTTFLLPGIKNSSSIIKKINYKIAEKSKICQITDSLTSRDTFFIIKSKILIQKNDLLGTEWKDIPFPLDFKNDSLINIVYQISNQIIKTKGSQNFLIYGAKSKMLDYAEELYEYIPNYYDVSKNIKILIEYLKENYGEQYSIIKYLTKGIGIHKSETDEFTRYILEKEFKNKNIKYLFCSPTLLQGVNLNTKYLFILTYYMPNSGSFGRIDAHNLLGRIGRIDSYPHGFALYINNKDSKNLKEVALDNISIKNDIIDKNYLENEKNNSINSEKIKKIELFFHKINNHNGINFYSHYVSKKENSNDPTFLQDYFLEKKIDKKIMTNISLIKLQLKKCINWLFSKKSNFDKIIFKEWINSIVNLNIDDFNKFKNLDENKINFKYAHEQYSIFLVTSINFIYNENWSSEKIYLLGKIFSQYLHNYSIKTIANLTANYYIHYNLQEYEQKYIYIKSKIKRDIPQNSFQKFDKNNDQHMTILLDNVISMISKEIEFNLNRYINNICSKIFSEEEIKNIEKQIETLTNNEKIQFLLEIGIFKQFAIILSSDDFNSCFYKDLEKNIFFDENIVIKNLINKLEKTNSQKNQYVILYLKDKLNHGENSY